MQPRTIPTKFGETGKLLQNAASPAFRSHVLREGPELPEAADREERQAAGERVLVQQAGAPHEVLQLQPELRRPRRLGSTGAFCHLYFASSSMSQAGKLPGL